MASRATRFPRVDQRCLGSFCRQLSWPTRANTRLPKQRCPPPMGHHLLGACYLASLTLLPAGLTLMAATKASPTFGPPNKSPTTSGQRLANTSPFTFLQAVPGRRPEHDAARHTMRAPTHASTFCSRGDGGLSRLAPAEAEGGRSMAWKAYLHNAACPAATKPGKSSFPPQIPAAAHATRTHSWQAPRMPSVPPPHQDQGGSGDFTTRCTAPEPTHLPNTA